MSQTKDLVQCFAHDYVQSRLVKNMRCPKCGRPLLISEAVQYPFQCVCCDEDFFEMECLHDEDPITDEEIKALEKGAEQLFVPEFDNIHCSSTSSLAKFLIQRTDRLLTTVKHGDTDNDELTFSQGYIDGIHRFDDYIVSRQYAPTKYTFAQAVNELDQLQEREKIRTIVPYNEGYIQGLTDAIQQLINVYQCSTSKKFSHFLSRYLMKRKEMLDDRMPILLQIIFKTEDSNAPYYQVFATVYGTTDDMRQIEDSFASYIDSVKNVEDLDYDEYVEDILNASHLKWEKSSEQPSTKSIYTIWI